MAKAPVSTTAALLMGTALLVAINAAAAEQPGYLFINQEQAGSVDPSHIQVNSEITDGDRAAAILSDEGRAFLAANPLPAERPGTTAPAQTSFEIEDGVAMPTGKRGGAKAGYPFEALGVGQSFHVAKTAENPDPANRLASSVTGARAKYSTPMVDANGAAVMEEVTVRTYKKGEDGKYLKTPEGKRVPDVETKKLRQKTVQTREFAVASVPASDPKGVGARVWRTL